MAEKQKRKKKTSPHALLPMMLSVILAAGCMLNIVHPFSEGAEKSALASFPSLSWSKIADGSWMENVSSWYAEQLTGRSFLIHLNYLIRKAGGDREINDVFLGKGALFAQNAAADPEIYTGNVRSIIDFAEADSIRSTVLLVPSAADIQTQKLPAFAPVISGKSAMDDIYKKLAESNVTGIDLRDRFTELKNETLYYKTDPHWTSYGAGQAYIEMMNQLGAQISLETYKAMPVSTDFQGSLAERTGSFYLTDEIDIYVANRNPSYLVTWSDGTKTGSIYDMQALDQNDPYDVFLGPDQSVVRIQTGVESKNNLLLLKDSYASSMIQFMLPHYASITLIDPELYSGDLQQILEMYSINEVLFVFSYDTFVTSSALQDVLNPYTVARNAETAAEKETAEESSERSD